MKKISSFLRSMTFGMILLLLIAACSVAGSLIPQQREAMEYVARYGAAGAEWIIRLGLDLGGGGIDLPRCAEGPGNGSDGGNKA